MRQIIIILIFVFSAMVDAQEVTYHLYSPTSSSWDIVEFDLFNTAKHKYLLKETIDKKGRISQLEFLRDGKLIDDPLCYLANRVTFEYFDNKIVENLYHNSEELLATDCEMHYQTIYYLDNEGFIEKTESLAKYDFIGIKKDKVEKWKEWIPEKIIVSDSVGKNLQVEYYYYSSAKMNGIYPINRNYKYNDDYFYEDEPENFSILNGIEKLKD